ncbi:hypothetical protein V6N13_059859 [Hibiscus sabdariffa]
MFFSHHSAIKAAVKQYVVLNRYNMRLKVNDSRRLQVVYKDGCPWMIWASRLNPKDVNETTWQIKTYIGDHSCIRDNKNANCTSRWLAKAYIEKWRVDPTYSIRSLQNDVQNDHIIHVSLSKCSKAKKLALEMIYGNDDEQYSRICDYIGELRGTNPGTTTICRLDNRIFERMYIFLQAYKDGFKGLIDGISELFHNAEHKTYVRHLYSNFKNRSGFARCWPMKVGGNRYEILVTHEDQHVVHLGSESCTCRNWDLTRIPCIHAIIVIIMKGERSEGYVNNCYKKETQLQIYSNIVRPLRGPKQWAHRITNEPILPPVIRRPVGKPQRNRRKR